MTIPMTQAAPQPRRLGRSIGAFLAGFLAVVFLSLGTDQLLHVLKVYPPWGEAMWDPRLNALALSYRIVYAVLGSFISARLAPRNPMLHAMALGCVGLALSVLGAFAAIQAKLGPAWYPIALALTTLPCAWLGGKLQQQRSERRS